MVRVGQHEVPPLWEIASFFLFLGCTPRLELLASFRLASQNQYSVSFDVRIVVIPPPVSWRCCACYCISVEGHCGDVAKATDGATPSVIRILVCMPVFRHFFLDNMNLRIPRCEVSRSEVPSMMGATYCGFSTTQVVLYPFCLARAERH